MTDDNKGVTDQPSTESLDQPGAGVSREEPKGSQQTVEVNGETLTLEELKAGFMRNQDYTKKTQELADAKRKLARTEESTTMPAAVETDEIKKAKQQLKALGFATQEDLDKALAIKESKLEDSRKLDSLLGANPELAKHREAIEAIGKTDNSAWEDIIVKYNFAQKDKLAKAKSHDVMGQPIAKSPKEKSIRDMSPKEYEAWKTSNLKGSMLKRSTM